MEKGYYSEHNKFWCRLQKCNPSPSSCEAEAIATSYHSDKIQGDPVKMVDLVLL